MTPARLAGGRQVKRCVECSTVFDRPQQYTYRNDWRQAPICRNQGRCRARRGHTFRPCRIWIVGQPGAIVRCGYNGCGYAAHATQAALS